VQTRTDERFAAGTGLAATLVVGVAALIGAWTGERSAGLPATWWAGYGVFLVAFVADSDLLPARLVRWQASRPAWLRSEVLAFVEVAAALVVWFAAPAAGWSAVLFVVSAVSVAFVHSRPVAVAVIAVQTLAVAVGNASLGLPTTDVVLSTVIYASFQAFSGLVVLSARREADSRAALAAAHADLRAASTLLAASTRDAERLRISRDLHDVVGHQLTALALELEVASHRVEGAGAEHVVRARGIAKDLLRDVRSTVGDLRTEVHGLEAALRDVVDGVPGLAVDLTVDERVPVEQVDALVVVRCVQELVTNAMRHAGARRLTVRVAVDDGGVTFDAHDDGHGARRLELGHGLTGMSERVEHRGGVISFDPGSGGRGFGVTARIPAP
jgi:signal transduction histidine kinase